MSAIAGVYYYNGEPAAALDGSRMMEAMEQLPAARVSSWHTDLLYFGCRDQRESPASTPEALLRHDPARGLAVTADVLLDNRDELMERLDVPRALRADMPDGEILLRAYEVWGQEMAKHLVGEFAFVIWDAREGRLFGARDFSGARTLYFYRDGGRFAFASIIAPLFALPGVEKRLNEPWLAEYLAITGMFEPPDCSVTVYRDIGQLPPSHTITVTERGLRLAKYTALDDIAPLKLKSNADYEEAFRDVFGLAVRSRLGLSSQVGAFLSGGLDSGSVASFAAQALREDNRPLHTFSYIPEDGFVDWTPKYKMADERPMIQTTVRHVGNIQDRYLDFKGQSPLTELDDWLTIMESPYKFFENSFWLKGVYELASRQGIGLLLNGQRGNYSISWGPAVDYYAQLLKRLKWFKLAREVRQYCGNVGVRPSRVYSVLGRKAIPALERRYPLTAPYEFPQLLADDYARQYGVYEKLQDRAFTGIGSTADLPADPIEARKQHFSRVNMWNITGTSGAKLSMRYGVRGHDPTNDLRVIRYCLSLPLEQFVQEGLDRALIRRSTKGLLPDGVRLNQRVRGIQAADLVYRMAPQWDMFVSELRQMSEDARMRGMLNAAVIQDGIAVMEQGPKPEHAFHPQMKLMMRSLIVYRFLKKAF
ncbi:asparagine synthase-related protein [Paenibacillus aurantiacus]|uniref:asparagine synthase (glutamine-hydrolyzing) n=1 Tax=Paenibacillus aurantiacus TaxID=1936118 RepID=A0ABV5KIJ2_9BACL